MLSTKLTIIAFLAAAWCQTSEAGVLYDVACPTVNSELQCPEGQVIEVLSMEHGPASDADCAARNQPAKVTDNNCIHPAMLPWVKFICNRRERCRLPKPNPLMFMCDAADNLVQISYQCSDRIPDERKIVACDGEAAELKCENGVISILAASYGRFDENTCTETPSHMTFCSSFTAFGKVYQNCLGKEECKVIVAPENLGQPIHCDSKPKYLTVDYICVEE